MQRERRKNNDILFHFRKDGLPMTKLSQLKIDPEFQNQINPPSFEETHQLEMNILKEERVLNPIITWNGYIVDGHTRYQILRKYPFIPFEVIEKEFSSRYEALAWICKNQLGRRNLTPEQKKFQPENRCAPRRIILQNRQIWTSCFVCVTSKKIRLFVRWAHWAVATILSRLIRQRMAHTGSLSIPAVGGLVWKWHRFTRTKHFISALKVRPLNWPMLREV